MIEINDGTYSPRNNNIPEHSCFIEYFEQKVKAKFDNHDKSKYRWSAALKWLKSFAGGAILFKDITPSFIAKFKNYLLDKVSQTTAKDDLNVFGQVLKNALWDGIIESNPMDKVDTRIARSQTQRVFLIFDELKKLDKSKNCSRPVVKDAFLFSCYTGLRFSDVNALTWDKIFIEDGKHFLYYTQLKTAKPERLPVSESALKYLPTKKTTGIVFKLPNLKITNKVLKTWIEDEKINKKVTFHVARHTFATLALNIGIDLKVVSKHFGHSEVRTTEIYAKIIDKTKEEAVGRLSRI